MNSAVCTLFEGNYHYGLAALANSLHRAGFRGQLYAGYRGELPDWALSAVASPLHSWPLARSLQIDTGLTIVFLPLETDYHLTNYKADFMLALFDGPVRDADALFYVDPDICVICPWTYVLDWVSCGVALCEDVNSPLPEHHPRRVGWREYYAKRGVALKFRAPEYVNGGFVGVRGADRAFLTCWKQAMDLMAEEIGSLRLALSANSAYRSTGFADCFDRTDQDGLNVAIESSQIRVSVIGKEAMGLKAGSALIPHALGHVKPWRINYVRWSLSGFPPRLADKAFWSSVAHPISPYSAVTRRLKQVELAVASAIGRFFSRA
ncbi:MAG: hypothetical protein QFE16_03320 [Pseudomonadota bacterium]|nr:hypothetical protein [Pseudomonadota bacterium]